jgi:hypothetical protein
MPVIPEDDGWKEYRRLVLDNLQKLSNSIEDLSKRVGLNDEAMNRRISLLELEINTLKTKAVMIGVFAGGVVSLVTTIAMKLLFK